MDAKVFTALSQRVETIERKVVTLCRQQQDMGLKRWLDNQEVCETLGISKRTLQNYRDSGLLPFTRLRHKIYYKPEDVERMLRHHHHSKKVAHE